jgi:integrase
MASLQRKGDGWYCQFMYRQRRHTFAVGKVDEAEAQSIAARVDYVLMRLKQGLMDMPAGCDIVAFVQHDGRPPLAQADAPKEIAFNEFRDAYFKTVGKGSIEGNSLYTARIHLGHLAATLGERFTMSGLAQADLQRHIDRRQKDVAAVTIKKEIDSLRSAWNWACRRGLVKGSFPSGGLVYPKGEEKLPFMTWTEIARRIKAGGVAEELWECLYLTTAETAALLEFVEGRKAPPWVYPMFLFACHTGARRSEMIRAKVEDMDIAGGVATIREKKRVRGRLTTRRVPLSGDLSAVLKEWMPARAGQPALFGTERGQLSPQAVQKAFVRVLKGSKWSVLKGWHVCRHSFISALASGGVDQRIIDDFVGHQTDEQRRRYRHLYPSTQQQAIRGVFG